MSTDFFAKNINRRDFFKIGAKVAASTALLSMSAPTAWGAFNGLKKGGAVETVALNNGVRMPVLGFGTLHLKNELGETSVADAIAQGYRLFDTATIYGNEAAVGAGIKLSGIDRKELFITSKVWVDDYGYETARAAFETSIQKLGVDYLDLYLIHRPRGDIDGTWRAMKELYEEGRIRAIGVSNFEANHLADLIEKHGIVPAVNQIETHAFFQQPGALALLEKYGIQMEAWSPFAQGRNGMFENETLAAIGKQHGKTNAQVCLRWHYQRGIVSIPRSSKQAHRAENLNIFDFKLSEQEMNTIAKLDLNKTQFPEWT